LFESDFEVDDFSFDCACVWANASACASVTQRTGILMGICVLIHVSSVWHKTVRVETVFNVAEYVVLDCDDVGEEVLRTSFLASENGMFRSYLMRLMFDSLIHAGHCLDDGG
jgi:hypothetical protein